MDFYSAAGICATTKGTVFKRITWVDSSHPLHNRFLRFNNLGEAVFDNGKTFDFEKNKSDYLDDDWQVYQRGVPV